MTAKIAYTLYACFLLCAPLAAQQKILVLCTNDRCDYRPVASLLIDGRPLIRALPAAADKVVGPAQIRNSREIKIDQTYGLYREPHSGVFYDLGADGKPSQPVVPAKLGVKEAVSPASIWRGAALEYRDTQNAKTGTAVSPDAFAYLLVSPNGEQATFALLQRLMEPSESDPRRPLLIQGALRFSAKSPALSQLRESFLARIREDLKRYEDQEADPTTLSDVLQDAVNLRANYLLVADEGQNKDLLDVVAAAERLFTRRLAVAEILRQAGYWDEYLLKLEQFGLGKWSLPEFLPKLREALRASSELHRQHSQSFANEQHWDRAFDEAELASKHNSCDASVLDLYYQARIQLVDHNKIASSPAYAGPDRAILEQIVRELEQLDPRKEQLILDRIRQGEARDPSFLPWQWKKAEFLDLLGKYSEALQVVRRIERNIPLDPKQLEECLSLDGRIKNNLVDTIQKSQDETRALFEGQQYQAALDAAAKGLKADPANAPLLYYSALCAAFLRQRAAAIDSVRAYLGRSDLLCAPSGEPEKVLDLYRLLLARAPVREQPTGIPNWISGMRYNPGEVFYDPVSLGFLQPVKRVDSKDGLSTVFDWEDRSFLVRSISTAMEHPNPKAVNGPSTTVFEAEPKYDRKALAMLEIGSRATSAGERAVYPLTYLNSPGVDPDLVHRFTGRQIARGWAGNPYFHPFIWRGFYVFDLVYDRLGRVETATPIREEAGSRIDPFSEPLKFTWEGDSRRLVSIRGTRSGYLRELSYEKDGRLKSEKITYPKGGGSIEYEYVSGSPQLKNAKCEDNFYDKRQRLVYFDVSVLLR